jgi:hypothetical protein
MRNRLRTIVLVSFKEMSTIYLVVKESGEYSQWDKENLMYFTQKEDADKYVEVEQVLNDIRKGDNMFAVEPIVIGTLPTDIDEVMKDARERQRLGRKEYRKQIAEDQQERATKERESQVQETMQKYDRILEQREQQDKELSELRSRRFVPPDVPYDPTSSAINPATQVHLVDSDGTYIGTL